MRSIPTSSVPTVTAAALVAGLAACAGGDSADGAAEAPDDGEAAAETASDPTDGGEGDGATADAAGGPADEASAGGEATGRSPLFQPASAAMTRRAPGVYRVRFTTTEGEFTVEVHRAWAPRGADRFFNLAREGFFDGARFFRVIEGFVAQFGLSGRPRLDNLWRGHPIRDDSVARSNTPGTVSFASAGEDTRTTQLFVNLGDNARLDEMGFAPIGRVTGGMDVVRSLYSGCGEGAPRGSGPSQRRILSDGNRYLEQEFSNLDYIEDTRVEEGPSG